MKSILVLLFCLFAFNSFAKVTQVNVLSAQFGVTDSENRKTLCLAVVEFPKTRAVIGVVEPIEDCFYTRKAKSSPNKKLLLDEKYLKRITNSDLSQHLQTLHMDLEFYFSDGD